MAIGFGGQFGGGGSANQYNPKSAFNPFSNAGNWGANLGFSNPKGQDAANAQKESIQQQQGAEQGILDKEKAAGQQFFGGVQSASNNFLDATARNAGIYTGNVGTISGRFDPQYGQLTKNAMGNANSAMSLQDAMNPNNSVEQGVQGMYNQQAQGIQNQGLADYGVLAALGGQATQNTMGGGAPMTGGQMQALQGANMGQASQAFGAAQNQANQMKLQGLQSGINQSNLMYGAGQQAQGTAANAVGNQANFQQGINQDIFGTNQGVASTNFGVQSGLSGLNYDIQNQGLQNEMGMNNQVYGAQQQSDIAQAQAAQQAQQGKLSAMGQLVGQGVGAGAWGAEKYMNSGMAGMGG
jgi:hypothetical protein